MRSYLLSVARHAGSKKKPMQNRGLSIGLAAGIVALVLMFINACVLAPALPAPSAGTTLASYLVVLCVGAGFYFMYRTATRDPGILTGGLETLMLPRPGAGAAARLDIPTLWAGNWGSLCVTCKLVRPLGAKHCSVINKCVARFDHFCPWVGNTIGKRNHRDFAAFLVLQSFALLVSVLTAFTRASHSGMDFAKLVVVCPSLLAFLAIDLVVALPVIMLTSAQVTQLGAWGPTLTSPGTHPSPDSRPCMRARVLQPGTSPPTSWPMPTGTPTSATRTGCSQTRASRSRLRAPRPVVCKPTHLSLSNHQVRQGVCPEPAQLCDVEPRPAGPGDRVRGDSHHATGGHRAAHAAERRQQGERGDHREHPAKCERAGQRQRRRRS